MQTVTLASMGLSLGRAFPSQIKRQRETRQLSASSFPTCGRDIGRSSVVGSRSWVQRTPQKWYNPHNRRFPFLKIFSGISQKGRERPLARSNTTGTLLDAIWDSCLWATKTAKAWLCSLHTVIRSGRAQLLGQLLSLCVYARFKIQIHKIQ